jgi:hypothetical protein
MPAIPETPRPQSRQRRYLKAMIQTGYDVKRIQRDTLILEKLVKHRGSQKAAALLPKMKSSLIAAEVTWQHERTFWNSYRGIADAYEKIQPTTVGKMALAFEETLQKSPLGRGLIETGRFAEHSFRWIAGGIVIAGACVALTKGVNESSTRTIAGRAIDGALSGGANIMVGRNPIIGLSDHVIKKTLERPIL